MFPITLDLSTLPVILAGNGPRAQRRLMLLDEDRAGSVTVHAPKPSEELATAARERLVRRWPTPAEIASAKLLLIADGVEASALADLVAVARAAGTLVNVEDRPELSDFHSPATVRRGDLLVTVSTG
jgi:precorrin-2 dehydrogenase/sirohydrochlorin ferrochelatase